MLTDEVGLRLVQRLDCVMSGRVRVETAADILRPSVLKEVLREVVPEVREVDTSTIVDVLKSVDGRMDVLDNLEPSRLTQDLLSQPTPSLVVEYMLVCSTLFGWEVASQAHVVAKILELSREEQEQIQMALEAYANASDSDGELACQVKAAEQLSSARRRDMAEELDALKEAERIRRALLAEASAEVHHLREAGHSTTVLVAPGTEEIERLELQIRDLKSRVEQQKTELKELTTEKDVQAKIATAAMEEAAVLEEEIRSLSNQLGRIKAKHADMFELEERAVAAQKQADGYLTQLLAAQSRLSRITVYKDTDSKARTIESLQRNLQILQASHDKLTAQNRHLKVALDQAEQRQARPRSAAPNDGDIRVSISLREKEELLRLRKQPEDGDLRSRLHAALAANDALEKRVEAQSHQLSRYSDSSPGSAGLRRRENQLLTESRADESSSRRREHRTMVATIHELAFRVHLLQIEHTAALGGRAQVEAASMDE